MTVTESHTPAYHLRCVLSETDLTLELQFDLDLFVPDQDFSSLDVLLRLSNQKDVLLEIPGKLSLLQRQSESFGAPVSSDILVMKAPVPSLIVHTDALEIVFEPEEQDQIDILLDLLNRSKLSIAELSALILYQFD